ncbi:MAG: hypothetical protein QXG57_08515 [Thermofilaceae archaeon]
MSSPGFQPPDFFSSLYEELDTGWPWPLDSVQRFFESLWSFVADLPGRIYSVFSEKLRDAFAWLGNSIVWPLIQFSWEVWRITEEWFGGWSEPWKSIARLLSFPSAFAYKALRDAILPRFTDVVVSVRTYFDGAVGGVFNAIRNAFEPIFKPLSDFASAFHKFVVETVPGFFDSVASFFNRVVEFFTRDVPAFFGWIRDGLNSIIDFFAKAVPEFFTKTIPETLKNFATWLWDNFINAVKTVWGWISDNVVPPLRSAIEGVWSAVQSAVRELVESVRSYWGRVSELAQHGDIVGIVLDSLPLLGASLAVAVVVDLASLKIVGSGFDPQAVRQQIAKFIDSIFDPKIFTSVFLAVAVQKPLEYAVKYQFRTEIPPPGDLLRFYAKNWIDLETLREYMRRHGFSDYWVDIYERSVWVEPRFDQVFTAYMRGVIPREDYERWLNILNILQAPRPGMRVPDISIFEESMYRMPSPFVIAYAADSGILSEDDIKEVLRMELVHPRFVDITARALYYRSLRDEISQAIRALIDDYADLAVPREELVSQLRGVGKRPEEIDLLSRVAEAKRRRSIRRMFVRTALDSYLNADITEEELSHFLARAGLDPEAVNALLDLARIARDYFYVPRKTADERRTLAAIYLKRYARGLVSEVELYAKLAELMFSEEEIRLRTEIAELDKEEEIRKLREDYLKEMIRQGFISRTDAVDYCSRYIASREYCTEYVELLFSKYLGLDYFVATRDERTALATTLAKAYLRGLLTMEELVDRLRTLRFTDEEIRLRIERVSWEERIAEVDAELKTMDQMLKRGEVTPEEYVSYAVALGVREDYARSRAERLLKLPRGR